MALNKGKHTAEEIDGVRCTVVEKGAGKERVEFLKDLLEFNKLEVKVQEEKRELDDAPVTFTVGVTDLVFNPMIAIYQMRLMTRDGKKVSPAYYRQQMKAIDNRYWRYRAKTEKKPVIPDDDVYRF